MKVVKISLFVCMLGTLLTMSYMAGYASASFGGPLSVGAAPLSRVLPNTGDHPKLFDTLDEIYGVLKREYVVPGNIDADKLGRGAIEGVITALDDRHTHWLDPRTRQQSDEGVKGSYEGIGASVNMEDGLLTVVSPLVGSPAETAGLRSGDKILAIDGVSVQGLTLTEAVERVKGQRGTAVKLLIQRQGQGNLDLSITRDEIKTASVNFTMLADNIAHIRIVQFAQRTNDEMAAALKNARDQGAKGIVLDLRNNPGGLLDTTVDITNMFLDGGLAGYQVDRNGKKETLPLKGKGAYTDIPMVVLVNAGSASGSELLSGALQDRGRAKLIGTRTYGKGSVNHMKDLSDGSALYVTIGRWLTPNGTLIEGNGLTPDFQVALTDDDVKAGRDAQMEKALEVLKAGR